jgi:hypothetical protein
MLQVAKLHHTGRVPSNGVPLPGLTSDDKVTSGCRTILGLVYSVLGSFLALKLEHVSSTRRNQIVYEPPLTVNLLDESEW